MMGAPDTPELATSAREIRILVADDHEVMRMGIRNLIESVPNWSVAAEASTGREAVELALHSPPDIIIGHHHAGNAWLLSGGQHTANLTRWPPGQVRPSTLL